MRPLLACVGSCLVLAALWFVLPSHPGTGQHRYSTLYLFRQTGRLGHVFIRSETKGSSADEESGRASATNVDPVGDKDILYFVKACKRFQQRSLRLYQAWGNKVANVIFSTDQLLDGIPKRLQRIEPFDQPGDVSFQKEAEHWFHAASCGTTWINLGKVLLEEDCMNILIKVDDIR
eukprot:scpid78001/ scgid8441/ 